jgi:hypothetical protein
MIADSLADHLFDVGNQLESGRGITGRSRREGASGRLRPELPTGYAFKLDGKAISLAEVAEWISMERLCCPFLTLQLSASGKSGHLVIDVDRSRGCEGTSASRISGALNLEES